MAQPAIPTPASVATPHSDGSAGWDARVHAMPQQRRIPAWILSCCLHSAIITVLVTTYRFVPRGGPTEPERTGGVVFVHQAGDQREYVDGQAMESSQAAAATNPSIDNALPTDSDIAVDLSGVLPANSGETSSSLTDALPTGEDLTTGGKPGGGIDGSVRTEVFGLAAEGTKFVYVFDRSGSMSGYQSRPLIAAKMELLKSLQDLRSVHQFQIIFYNETPRIFQTGPGTPRLAWGDDASKEAARRFVRGISAEGSTRHFEALRLALGMRPDVVFFLTDADEPRLSDDEMQRVRRLNYGTTIHAIEFGLGLQRRTDNFLTQLAKQNGGQHVYVDITGLPAQ
ncbi:MAG: hypothetical protein R3E01_08390 [Pirellulaceae bacterium]|nr:hypothetical protein [Planctomycetales bacterium]